MSNEVELSGGKLLVDDGNCGTNSGGAATVVPMLVQPLFVGSGDGFAITLRSTGVIGADESQLDVGGGDSVFALVGQGGGARLLPVVEVAAGAAGCVAKGLFDCEG